MKKKITITLLIIGTILIVFGILNIRTSELKTIKSEKQLERIYSGDNEVFIKLLTVPFSLLTESWENGYYKTYNSGLSYNSQEFDSAFNVGEIAMKSESSSLKDYSTTNNQVENVDEADIIKTDGDYIYSLSKNEVIITDVKIPNKIKVVARITNNSIPRDLIIYNNKLVVIGATQTNRINYNTVVNVYDISEKQNPKIIKSYELNQNYCTTRCIDGKLYVFACGNLKKENNKIINYYNENKEQKDIGLSNIQYLKDIKTNKQTLISMLDLNNAEQNVKVKSYLMDVNNAYISEKNIYLLDNTYGTSDDIISISSIFGLKGIFGIIDYNDDEIYNQKTRIFKFSILEDGNIEYCCKAEVKGTTINQYSVDEYEGNLRIALQDNNGSRIVVLNNKLREIGKTSYLAKGEKMYSSRFTGEKAYLVTYKTIDPLFVIDLSQPTNPKVLGELKIPGYSTYLHPYDENHIIGIGMDTKENIYRDLNGNINSTSASIIGMKMALFDISDVNNPKEISSISIGDSRTTSAILTNAKALLFSKEKEIIAIPVNNYPEQFEISESTGDNSEASVNAFENYGKTYTGEGYLIYNINVDNGIELKGKIIHKNSNRTNYYNSYTILLRGLYIDNNLYTVSEGQIKVNDLETLDLITEIKI